MLLAIDVRNTHTVVGLISGSGDHAKVAHHWRIRTESEVTADELALTIDGLIGDDSERLTGAAGLATVPSVLHELRVMLSQYWPSVPHVLIEPGVRTGIPLLVDNPKEVGADRIVNCLAAYQKYKSAAIVIDFGSSICVDVVSAKGEFLGGAIAPGASMMLEALHEKTAQLPKIDLAAPAGAWGRNTSQAIQQGIYHGIRGMVKELVENYATALGNWPEIIATGGDAQKLFGGWELIHAIAPDLTLYGIALAYTNHHIKHGT